MSDDTHLPGFTPPGRSEDAPTPAVPSAPADAPPRLGTTTADIGDAVEVPPAQADAAQSPPVPLPGPGLLESAVWIAAFFLLQMLASTVLAVAILVVHLFNTGAFEDSQVLPALQSQEWRKLVYGDYMGEMMGGMQIILMLAAIGAAMWRLGKPRLRRLPIHSPQWRQWLLIGVAWIPLSLLCGQLNYWANDVWGMLTERFPNLSGLDDQSSMDLVQKLVGNAAFGWILLGVAIGPAIGEELVFRGIIGRGLIARWGLPAGITITSLLFVAVHVQPAHVISLLPLAVFLHIAHVATRSIWAPIVLHFLNNLLAVGAMYLQQLPEVQQASQESSGPSPGIIVAGANLTIVLLLALWSIRTRYYHDDGTEWTPGYVTAERPPAELRLDAHIERVPQRLITALVVSIVLFFVALGAAGAR